MTTTTLPVSLVATALHSFSIPMASKLAAMTEKKLAQGGTRKAGLIVLFTVDEYFRYQLHQNLSRGRK